MLNNNKKLVFDVDANQIKIKKLLKKRRDALSPIVMT